MNLAEIKFSVRNNASQQSQMLEHAIRIDDVSVKATSAI